MSATTADIPLTANGGAAAPMVDHKIDPSIGQAISHGNVGNSSEGTSAPAYAADAPNGTATSGATQAAPEKAGSLGSAGHQGEATTTTTTTIITTTTGPPANGSTVASPVTADGASIASPNPGLTHTAPTSPVVGGDAAAAGTGAGVGSALTARDGTTTDSATAPTTAPTTTDAAAPASKTNGAVPAAAAGVAGAGVGAAAAGHKKEEVPPMSAKDAKKYTKLLKKEAKNEEKELAAALSTAHTDEKAMRKARKAEQQSIKRHQSAVSDEHKYSKALNKAKLSHEKAAAALQKATDELDIKKRHTAATSESYEKIKSKIDTLRNEKIANDKDRARRQASISQAA